jgi:transposase
MWQVRPRGSPAELEHRRKLAVQRLLEGYTTDEVAEFLGIDPSSVRRWRSQYRAGRWAALAARVGAGRPPRLSCTQEKIVRRWLKDPATEHGFTTDLWSGSRLAKVIGQEFGVTFHPDYLGVWLRQRGYTPQRPQRKAREGNAQEIIRWVERDWPRIKKKRLASTRRWL